MSNKYFKPADLDTIVTNRWALIDNIQMSKLAQLLMGCQIKMGTHLDIPMSVELFRFIYDCGRTRGKYEHE